MKLSLALSALLVGGSLFMSGCGSDSSSNDTKTQSSSDAGNSSSAAAVEAPKFTTEMLAGKTLYAYSRSEYYENNVFTHAEYNRDTVLTISADAKTVSAVNYDGETIVSDTPISIVGDKLNITDPDGLKVFMLLGTNGSNMYVVDDWSDELWATSEQADNGKSIFEKTISEQTLTKEILTAHAWYNLDWSGVSEEGESVNCHALFTYNADNSMDASYIDEDGKAQSILGFGNYVVSDNKLEKDYSQDGEIVHGTNLPLLVTEDCIIWAGSEAMFKNRDDAVTFSKMFRNNSNCEAEFPVQ